MYLHLLPLLLRCGCYKKVHLLFLKVVQASYTGEEQEVKANRLTEELLSYCCI